MEQSDFLLFNITQSTEDGEETESDSDRLGKAESSDGRMIEFTYTCDNTNGKYEIFKVSSGNKLKSELTYVSDKLLNVQEYSLASSIKHGDVTETAGLLLSSYTVTYTEVTTTIADRDGNKVRYLFDNL